LLWNLAMAAVLVWLDRRLRLGRGRVMWAYVALYTAGRFWIEMLRVDTAEHVDVFGFSMRLNVYTAAIMFIVAIMAFALIGKRRPEREADARLVVPSDEEDAGEENADDDDAAVEDTDEEDAAAGADSPSPDDEGVPADEDGDGAGDDEAEDEPEDEAEDEADAADAAAGDDEAAAEPDAGDVSDGEAEGDIDGKE
jgi:hypothetical protein